MLSAPIHAHTGIMPQREHAAHVAGDDHGKLARAIHQHTGEKAEERVGHGLPAR